MLKKLLFFSLFLTYNLIGVSCGHVFLLTQRIMLGGLLSFRPNNQVLPEYSNPILSFIFQNLTFFRFSYHIIRLVCRVVTIFLLTQSIRLEEPFEYLEHGRRVHRKFSRGLWKKSSAKKMRKKWNSKWGWNILRKSHILSCNFFQRPSEHFLRVQSEFCRYLKGAQSVALYARKKNNKNIRHTKRRILTDAGTTLEL